MSSRTVTALVGAGDTYLGASAPFEVPGPWWSHVQGVTEHLDRLLGVPTAVVRLLDADPAQQEHGGPVTYHVEALDRPVPGRLDRTPRAQWPAALAEHPLRAWWARPAGPGQLVDWAVRELGRPLTGRPVQVKTWNLSCVYRLPAADLDPAAWAKATAPFAGYEPAAIHAVRRHDPHLAPEVLAEDPVHRRFAMRGATGTDRWDADAGTLCDVVRRWVAVQAALAHDPPPGLRPRPPAALLDELPRLLSGEAGGQLSPAELAAAAALLDRLPALVDELESAGLPPTLVHGDLHPGNLVGDGSRNVVIDWADNHLGHPAFDAHTLLRWSTPHQRDAVEAAWVEAWRRQLPGSAPHRALRPVAVLAALQNAVLYQGFLDGIEPAERVYHHDDPAAELRRALRLAGGH